MKYVIYLFVLLCCISGQEVPFIPLSGQFSVGQQEFLWEDVSRLETLETNPIFKNRVLQITIYYPIEPTQEGEHALYVALPVIEAYQIPPSASLLQKRAFLNRQLSNKNLTYPILVFSPGIGAVGFSYTSILEELASHGYVVICVSHAYMSGHIYIPEKNVVMMMKDLPQNTVQLREFVARCLDIGLQDFRFVYQKLVELNRTSNNIFYNRLDTTKIIWCGHSMGGMITSVYCRDPNNIHLAGINLDGGGYNGFEPDETGAWPCNKDIPFFKIHSWQNAQLENEKLAVFMADKQYVMDIKGTDHNTFQLDMVFFRHLGIIPWPLEPDRLPPVDVHKILCQHLLKFLDAVCTNKFPIIWPQFNDLEQYIYYTKPAPK